MMKLRLIFLFLLSPLSVQAQTEGIAALEAQLARSTNPDESIRLLEQLTDVVLSADLKRAETYTTQALRLAGENESELLNATAFLIAGKTFVQLTKLDSANLFLDRSLAGFEYLNEPVRAAEVLYWKGYIAANKREFSEASRHYFRSVEIWEQSGQQIELAKVYRGLADMFAMQDDYHKAMQYCQEAIRILEEQDEPILLAGASDDLSYIFLLSGRYDEAYEYAEKALQVYEAFGAEDVDTAVPIGLITNELVTNSLKHAFSERKKGQIAITLTTDENDMLQLHITDNGQANTNGGAPKDGGGFGTLLVQLLTTQLGGQFKKTTEGGTAITIRFPRQEKSAA